MNDTEETARRLFTVAAEDVPPGIDLLRAIRVQSRGRVVRIRSLVAAGAAGIVATAAAITLSLGAAPSAFAQVTHAAVRTAAASYRVRSAEKIVETGGLRSQQWTTASGEFDLARGVGEETDNQGLQIRYVGGYTYLFLTANVRKIVAANHGAGPIPAGASWVRLPGQLQPGTGVTPAGLAMLGVGPVFLQEVDPQNLLALLQSATDVRATGPASGPGWTGSAYAFTIATTLNGPLHTAVSLSGTVDVDQQGLVRQLNAVESYGQTERNVGITFGDFGLPVSVSPPPASQTWIPPTS
jgi:hypothetical protein